MNVRTFDPKDIHIRRATIDDAAVIAEIAARLFAQTFDADNDPANVTAHIESYFSEAKLCEELADPTVTYLLLDVHQRLAGFAALKAGSTDPSVRDDAPLEIQRFYVDHAHHGRGVAAHLMDACMKVAIEQGLRTVWLGVWERNPRAIRFYEKCGFVDVGGKTFQMGDDLQFDRVMALRRERD